MMSVLTTVVSVPGGQDYPGAHDPRRLPGRSLRPRGVSSHPAGCRSATHGPGIEAVVISGALAADALVPGLLDTKPAQLLTNT